MAPSLSIGDSVSLVLDEAGQTVTLEKPDAYTPDTPMADYGRMNARKINDDAMRLIK